MANGYRVRGSRDDAPETAEPFFSVHTDAGSSRTEFDSLGVIELI